MACYIEIDKKEKAYDLYRALSFYTGSIHCINDKTRDSLLVLQSLLLDIYKEFINNEKRKENN